MHFAVITPALLLNSCDRHVFH